MELLFMTLSLGMVDGFNPFAIIQQFIIQPLTKKVWHILYFIMAIFFTNFIIGMLFMYGLMDKLIIGYQYISQNHPVLIAVLLWIISITILMYLLIKPLIKKTKIVDDEAKVKSSIKGLTPVKLIVLGVVSTLFEVITAAPYFAFIVAIYQKGLPFYQILIWMIIYNFMYVLPLLILCMVYLLSRKHFDKVYRLMKDKIFLWVGKIVYIALILICIYGIFYAFNFI